MSPSPTDQRSRIRRGAAALFGRLRTHAVSITADDAGLATFADWCSAHRWHRCTLALYGREVRAVCAPAEAGRLPPSELSGYAQRVFQHYFGELQDAAETAWTVAASDDPRAPIACGVSRPWMSALARIAQAHRVDVRCVRPWWAPLVAAALPATGAVAAVEPAWITVVQSEQGRVCRIWTQALPAGSTAVCAAEVDWRSSEGERQMVTLAPNEHPAASGSYGIRRGPSWGTALNLMGQRHRASGMSWLALAATAVAAVVVVQERSDLIERQAAAQEHLDHVEHLRQRQAKASQPPSTRASNASSDLKTIERAAAILARLDHPWSEILEGVEHASPGAAMLGLEHSSDSATVDIEAAVSDEDAAWRMVQALGADSARFEEATLTSQQPLSTPTDGFALRIQLRARVKSSASEQSPAP